MTGANFQVVSMDSLSNWIEQRPPSLTNSSDLNAFFEKLASDSSDANELLTRLQQVAAEEAGKFGSLRISSSSAVPSGASTPSSSTTTTAVSLLIKSEPSTSSASSSSSSSSSSASTTSTTSLAMSSSTAATISAWEDSSSQPPSLINDENEPPASWKLSSSTNNVLAISSGLSSLRQSSDVNLLDSATIATESVLKLVREQILEVAKQEQQQQTEVNTPVQVQPVSTTTVTSSPPAAPVPLPASLRIPSPSPQPTVVRGSSFSGTLVSTVPQIQSEVIYSTPVTVHEKPQVLLNLEQLCAMIDCGAQLNMNALVGLGFEFEGRPFGLKLSILLQLLLHQAAFAYWMGKKSAPTASRNCRFEGATKGQTKYPKRKFCGWVNKVAEMTKPYGQEALCMALQELWSLLRLSPSEMDCTQTDNVKRVLSEFFRVHDLVMANGTNHTVTQLWTNVLTTASKPEVFMRRDEQSKRKRKSNSPTPPLDLEEDSSVSIKDEQTTLVALKPLKRSQSSGTTTKRRRSNPSPVSSLQATALQSSSLPSSFLERATSIARS